MEGRPGGKTVGHPVLGLAGVSLQFALDSPFFGSGFTLGKMTIFLHY